MNLKCFLFEFSESQDTDAREKNNDFLIENSSMGAEIWKEILMGEIRFVVAQN